MRALVLSLVLPILLPVHASVIGVSKPAEALTAARIDATLPASERPAWLTYLDRSQRQMAADKAALAAERAALNGPIPPYPSESGSGRSMPLNRDDAFYKSTEALHTAETILSFQIPSGGWSKNLNMAGPPRLPGQSYTSNNISRFLGPDDFDKPANPDWNYVGTLDNDATNTELHFLARMSTAYPGPDGERFRKSFLRGVGYLLRAQYPNGGWPQVWPLEGGYHDAITFNDNAVTESASLLHDSSVGAGHYGFVPADIRKKSAAASDRALTVILKCQLVLNGKKTIWAQQHDPLTLLPVAGRNFEPAALSAGESADLLMYLMRLPKPSPDVRASIEAGIAWLNANAIYGYAFVGGRGTRPPTAEGGAAPQPALVPRHLEAQPGAGPIWARYYSLTTGKPIFGDRDKTIHDDENDLSVERKNGYAWYSSGEKQALDAYAGWKK
jgi:PelA/Pel-15E family pectate lyase